MTTEKVNAKAIQQKGLDAEFSKADLLFKAWNPTDDRSQLAQLLECEEELFSRKDSPLDKATQASFTAYIHFLMTDFLLQQCELFKNKDSESMAPIQEDLDEFKKFGENRGSLKNRFVFGFLCTVGMAAELTDGALSALAVKAVVAPQIALPVGIAVASIVALSGLISWVGFECQAVARNSGVCLFSLHREMVTTLLMMDSLQKIYDAHKGGELQDSKSVSEIRVLSQLYCNRYLRRYHSVKPTEYPILKKLVQQIPTIAIGFSTVAFLLSVAGVITLPHISLSIFAIGIAALLIYRIYEYCSIDSKAVGESFDRATNNPRAEFKQATARAKHMKTTIESDLKNEEIIRQRDQTIGEQAEEIDTLKKDNEDKGSKLIGNKQQIASQQQTIDRQADRVAELEEQLKERDRMIEQQSNVITKLEARPVALSGEGCCGDPADDSAKSSVLSFPGARPIIQRVSSSDSLILPEPLVLSV